MMDKTLKEALREAYRAPAPERKANFLKQHRRRELGRWELAAVQAGYIRWWVWGLSLGMFGTVLWAAARPYPAMGLSCAAALTPFLALLAVSGIWRWLRTVGLDSIKWRSWNWPAGYPAPVCFCPVCWCWGCSTWPCWGR